jgi:hypothetical protein
MSILVSCRRPLRTDPGKAGRKLLALSESRDGIQDRGTREERVLRSRPLDAVKIVDRAKENFHVGVDHEREIKYAIFGALREIPSRRIFCCRILGSSSGSGSAPCENDARRI